MHRRYRPWHYEERIQRIHAAMPQAAIGADVLVGFPAAGETDEDFDNRALIERLPLLPARLYLFSRPGTPSAQMPEQAAGPAQPPAQPRVLRELAARKRSFGRSSARRCALSP